MKTLDDLSFSGKRVLVRVDYNVPMKNGRITDDRRIRASLETIKYLISKKAKIILMSHLGRPKGFDKKLSLSKVAARLSKILRKKVMMANENVLSEMKEGQVVMLENLRFNPAEKSKDKKDRLRFAKGLAGLADRYVNDAFGNSHRDHASMTGVPKYLPSCVGRLVEKEVSVIVKAVRRPKRPFVAVIGGAKADKVGVVKNLLKKADLVLVAGVLANTFLKARGEYIGASLYDKDSLKLVKKLCKHKKIILPVDCRCERGEVKISHLLEGDTIKDIGPLTEGLYGNILKHSRTVVWAGPIGVFEERKYSKGTKYIATVLSKLKGIVIVGGGDSAAAVDKLKLSNLMTHVSTGGGASLELFAGKELVALKRVR